MSNVRVVQTATTRIYGTGFQGLVKRWDKCLNLFGDYIEKQMLFVCHYHH